MLRFCKREYGAGTSEPQAPSGDSLLRKTETPLNHQLINAKLPQEVAQGSHGSHACLKFIVAALYSVHTCIVYTVVNSV